MLDRRNKGTCDNLISIRRDLLETKVLEGLKYQLMHPEMVTAFIEEFHREVNRQRAQLDGQCHRAAHDLEKTEREIRRLIEAIKSGVPGTAVKDEMAVLEAKRGELRAQLDAAPPSPAAPAPEPRRAIPPESDQTCRGSQ
jgi:site-specific DNA recombinase